MRLNDDKKTVRAMDVLFPGIGDLDIYKRLFCLENITFGIFILL